MIIPLENNSLVNLQLDVSNISFSIHFVLCKAVLGNSELWKYTYWMEGNLAITN